MYYNVTYSDPYDHREKRSVLSYQDLQLHLDHKSLHLLTLGNAAMESSYDYIMSYVNDSDAHILLKCSALTAIAKYHTQEVCKQYFYSI